MTQGLKVVVNQPKDEINIKDIDFETDFVVGISQGGAIFTVNEEGQVVWVVGQRKAKVTQFTNYFVEQCQEVKCFPRATQHSRAFWNANTYLVQLVKESKW